MNINILLLSLYPKKMLVQRKKTAEIVFPLLSNSIHNDDAMVHFPKLYPCTKSLRKRMRKCIRFDSIQCNLYFPSFCDYFFPIRHFSVLYTHNIPGIASISQSVYTSAHQTVWKCGKTDFDLSRGCFFLHIDIKAVLALYSLYVRLCGA